MSRNDRLEIDMLTEYISSIRNMIENHRRAFTEYTQSVTELNRSMYHIIELYLVLTHRTSSETNNTNTTEPSNYRINTTPTYNRMGRATGTYRPSNYTSTSRRNLYSTDNSTTNVTRNTSSTPVQTYFTQPRINSTRNENTPTRPRNFWHFPERRTTTSASRRRPRNTNRTRRQNFLQQILQTSLYTPTMRRPAAARDISRNTQTFFWREIQNQTSQSRCPITLETFQPGDLVSRITNCGHTFHQDALNTYLIDYDHRCPICRYNISNDIISPPSLSSNNTNTTTPASAQTPRSDNLEMARLQSAIAVSSTTPTTPLTSTTTTTSATPTTPTTPATPVTTTTYISQNNITTPSTTQNERNSIWGLPYTDNSTSTNPPPSLYRTNSFFGTDISRNFPEFNFTTTNDPSTFNLNLTNDTISDAINEISSVMMSSLNSALANPDNSGNTISAEYSLFVPTFTTTTTENYEDEDNVE